MVVDAGPLYAYLDADDKHHEACLDLLENHPGALVVPTLVIAEVAYLAATRLGTETEVRFLGDLASGAFAVEPVHRSDWLRIAQLTSVYSNLPLGTADASVAAAAERLSISTVATVDLRYFNVVRPRHCTHFEIKPP
ncbi:PIN domain-containing protein [Glycomyces luteolus]|uniref:Ribonuclease VapC n=1 Tax=Glycomyces luteolus TaxID=2670330 RepID=A0A9X3P7W9_9ACTN|nr:PIN domain-containing protein [Glycomyces luteolus]MDA1359281.1 PIN domain-containing protein [Glycomyces luteolus]